MPNWSGMILTKQGRDLQAKVEAGTPLQLTKMKLGDGTLPEGSSLETLVDLVKPKINLPLISVLPQANGLCKVTANIDNSEVGQGFAVRELGLFAQDPDEGEILYGIAADPEPDYLPPAGTATAISQEFILYIAISNAAEVSITVDTSAFITLEQAKDLLAEHNHDPDAHPNLKLSGVPVGTIVIFPFDSLPPGFMPCDGTYLDREAYKDLFEVIGTKYGEGDGTKTFNLPDLRGYFVRGLDDGKGLDQGRELGSVQGDAIRNIKGNLGEIVYHNRDNLEGAFYSVDEVPTKFYQAGAVGGVHEIGFDASKVVPTAEENRPKNIALVYAIKVFGAATNTGEVDVGKLAESVVELTNTLQQPAGSVLAFAGKKPPSGYLVCDGGEVGRATYPDLFEAIGTIYGEGDGKETFNLPDLRGQFLRGLGGNSGELGEQQGDAIRNITGALDTDLYTSIYSNTSGALRTWGANDGVVATSSGNSSGLQTAFNFDASKVVPTAEENRPVNMAILYCIKAFGSKTNVGQIDLTELANEMKNKTNYTDFASSHTKAGYQLFPNGGIRQRGVSAKLAPNSGVTVVLPLAMPDENYTVNATPIAVGPSSTGNGVGIVINNSSQFTIYNWGPIDIAGVHWTAEW